MRTCLGIGKMEKRPENVFPPKEIENKPALELAWRGLAISISEGYITRKTAMEILDGLEEDFPDGAA